MITELCPIFVITYSAEMNFIMLALSLCVLTGLFLWNRFLQVELLCQKNMHITMLTHTAQLLFRMTIPVTLLLTLYTLCLHTLTNTRYYYISVSANFLGLKMYLTWTCTCLLVE